MGEGAASTQGSDKAHWLPEDLGGVKGSGTVASARRYTSSGPRIAFVQDGALRTGSAVGDAAKGRAAALDRPLRWCHRGPRRRQGRPHRHRQGLLALPDGHPLAAAPLDQGTLRVRRVRHLLDKVRGFTTRLEFRHARTHRQHRAHRPAVYSRTQDARSLVQQRGPGQAGSVAQDLGREPVVVTMEGLLLGDDPHAALEELRQAQTDARPAFAADAIAGAERPTCSSRT